MSVEDEKRRAARAAAALVEPGMRVGLGTGTTVAHLLAALAQRHVDALYVASSPRTDAQARALGITTQPFDTIVRLDLAIDGADQVAANGWLRKGGGGAHTREKLIANAAERFVVIVDATKLVDELSGPVALELLAFGLGATVARVAPTTLRGGARSPDGGVLGDYRGDITDPCSLAQRLSSTPGVIEHGLFAPAMVSDVLVGEGAIVRRISSGGHP